MSSIIAKIYKKEKLKNGKRRITLLGIRFSYNKKRNEIISLGENCIPRTYSTWFGLKSTRAEGEVSCPFDLIVVPYHTMLFFLKNDFEGFFDDLMFSEENGWWYNSKHFMYFIHDKDCGKGDKAKLISRYEARIKNFRKVAKKSGKKLFVLYLCADEANHIIYNYAVQVSAKLEDGFGKVSGTDINELFRVLKNYFKGNIQLAVINHGSNLKKMNKRIHLFQQPIPLKGFGTDWWITEFRQNASVKKFEGAVSDFLKNILKRKKLCFIKKIKKQDKIVYKILGFKFTRKLNKSAEKSDLNLDKGFDSLLTDFSKMLTNFKYEIADGLYKENLKFPKVESRDELLDKLINSDLSLARLGDGEFMLMTGGEINFQSGNGRLKERLIEVVGTDKDNVLVGISNIFGALDQYEDLSVREFRRWLGAAREKIYAFLDFNKTYYDALVTRPYLIYKDKSRVGDYFRKFKQIWNKKDIVIVEGISSRLGVGNDLFDNTLSLERILCPAENAFDKYDEILEICKQQNKNKLFILALGPTATILAYDLAQEGFRALDLGHIDIEYEWYLRNAKDKIKIENKYVGEVAGGRIVENLDDEIYLKQIVGRID